MEYTNIGHDQFEEVFNEHKNKIFNIAYRMMGDIEDAQDIMQQTFYLAYKNFDSFRAESNVYTWLFRICANECLKQKKKNNMTSMDEYDDRLMVHEANKHKDWISNPENVAQIKELTNYIRSECHHIVLQKLTFEQRIVYIMRVIADMSYEQIAQTLDINENTVKARLNRARNSLLDHFQNDCNWFKHDNDRCCSQKLGYALSKNVDILDHISELTFDYDHIDRIDDKREFIDYLYKNLPNL